MLVTPTAAASPLFSHSVNLCAQLAPMASMLIFMAPAPTFVQIRRDKSTGQLPLLPYSSMISSCFLWGTYGILVDQPTIWATNAIGLFAGLYYFLTFCKYAPPKGSFLPGSLRGHMQGIVGIVAATLVLVGSGMHGTAQVVGKAAVALCIAMFASPLSALQTVLQTRSAKTIPLPFTLASLVNCFAWTVAGMFKMKDFNVILPNGLGLLCAILQLTLKVIYGEGRVNSNENLMLPL